MHSIKRHFAATAVLAFVLAALTGSALAAPPSEAPGQAKKAEETQAPAAQPAPAAEKTAPGQEKKAEQAAPAPEASVQQSAPSSAKSNPGQEKKAATQSGTSKATGSSKPAASTSSSSQQSTGVASTQRGVKPSNDTEKNTNCYTGQNANGATCVGGHVSSTAGGTRGANNDFSKRYGNGTTAAQIAVSRGGINIEIRGPGNSQPHKVCKKVTPSGKEVWADVHSVKTYVGVCTLAEAALIQQQPAVTTVSCPSATELLTAVVHHKGNGGTVLISPSPNSAHIAKHGEAHTVTLVLANGATCTTTVNVPTRTTTNNTTTTQNPVEQAVTEVKTAVQQALGTTVVSTTTTSGSGAAGQAAGQQAAGQQAGGQQTASQAAGQQGAAGQAGGVAGVSTPAGEAGGVAGAAGGVAGAVGGVAGAFASGTLPFTGFPVWAVILIAALAIVIGWTLMRRGRPATTRDVV